MGNRKSGHKEEEGDHLQKGRVASQAPSKWKKEAEDDRGGGITERRLSLQKFRNSMDSNSLPRREQEERDREMIYKSEK